MYYTFRLVTSPGSSGRPPRRAGGFCRLCVPTVMELHLGPHTPNPLVHHMLYKSTFYLFIYLFLLTYFSRFVYEFLVVQMCKPKHSSVDPAWTKSGVVSGRRTSEARETRGNRLRTFRLFPGRDRRRQPGSWYPGDNLLRVSRQRE